MFRFASTIFLSAFLLFQVQPLIGKYILPWFGGSPGVWTTCMLMFQILLLAGYGYAHFSITYFSRRTQGYLHLALLLGSLVSLPIIPDESWKPSGEESPLGHILSLLVNTIGIPYFLLSATGPLLQSWFARTFPGRSPFRLYSLSNVGSLLALISYPFVVEPSLTVATQATIWSIGYVVFALACGWNAVQLILSERAGAVSPALAARTTGSTKVAAPIAFGTKLLWLLLACTASIMLLATTNQICQHVAVIPFLWILPLALYLASFILTFDAPRWYRRDVFGPLLALSTAAAWYVVDNGPAFRIETQLVIYGLSLFVVCMTCHGELVRAKPEVAHLTLFYLIISVGGAIGGLFTALVAPRLFVGFFEYQIGLGATVVLLLVCLGRDEKCRFYALRPQWAWCGLLCVCTVLCTALGKQVLAEDATQITSARNFYGVLRIVNREHEVLGQQTAMVLGRIVHGVQCSAENQRRRPTAYFGPDSGFAVAMRHHPLRKSAGRDAGGLRVGVVGLGAGAMSVYGRSVDYLRFYEINPDVIRLANEHFTFVKDCPAPTEIVVGDARICLERELRQGSQRFDILCFDAFSSDAIPMHLLTRECFRTYLGHLQPGGLLVVNVSTNKIDLTPVVRGLAAEIDFEIRSVGNAEDKSQALQRSNWLILTQNRQFLADPEVQPHFRDIPSDLAPIVWTDDFGSLLQVLK
jgi:hypothetical protein